MQTGTLLQSCFSGCPSSKSIAGRCGQIHSIVLPFKAIYVRPRLRAALLIFAWTLSLLIFISYASSSEIIQEGHQTFCRTFASWNKIEKSVVFTVGFFIFYCVPLFSIIVLYSRIMKSLRQLNHTRRRETRKRKNRKTTSETDCDEGFYMDCQR